MDEVSSSIPATPKMEIRVSDSVPSPVPPIEPHFFGSLRCRIPNCECPCHTETERKPVLDTEDTSPLESAVAHANGWKDLPRCALRDMFETKNGRQRTRTAHERLAIIVGGTTEVPQFRTPYKKGMGFGTRSGARLHDVLANGRFIEVKLGGDRVTSGELEKDRYLVSL